MKKQTAKEQITSALLDEALKHKLLENGVSNEWLEDHLKVIVIDDV